ncbi:cysteine proteinase [Lentinus brumalis]|uniref:Ubiquitin carboxyl-terminal hydrolase n=1 Tax=Lentinus brumalis TaxID=2498619 RepID=A0A371DMZ5_9APHY|nr:cysteine proteinase [Polyporus brumalis]
MLASPLLPSPRFEETSYRPAKDLESFNKLLPPPIEFIEGSSSGVLAVAEGKYQPINEGPKQKAGTVAEPHEPKKSLSAAHGKPERAGRDSTTLPKSLYAGPIDTHWPPNFGVGRGLNNTGNTCFLNSALQCLLHTTPLLNILLKHTREDPCRVPKGSYCMICALRQVASETYSKGHSVTPYPVITKLHAIAKHLRRGRQEDSHEFLRYFVDALQRSALAGYPQKIDPKLAEKTWVYMIFGGLLRSRVKCLSCKHNSDTFDRMLDLSVDIAGVNSLRDALRKFVAVDHLRGADKYKCEKCKKPVNADKQFTVQEAPLVLTVHLKRFSPMGRKIGHPVRYDERISLEPYMSEGEFGPTYSLYGVISHAGGGPNSGHYYAHVKSSNGSWYEMNDESVMKQTGPPTGLKSAYVLFYIRDKGQALEAALSAPSSTPNRTPAKTSIVANMKKRKIVQSDDESERPSPAKSPKRFIGPLLPDARAPTPPPKDTPKSDPQATALKKKISAASLQPGKNAVQSLLADYTDDDDDDDDVGEKVAEKDDKDATPSATSTQAAVLKPLPARPPSPVPAPSPSDSEPPPAATAAPSASTSSAAIPPSSFYGTPAPKPKDKKRKSPDGDEDDDSYSKWAKTPLSPPPSKERRSSSGSRSFAANPYNRVKGGNNLHQRRDPVGPGIVRYGRKRRGFGI